MKLSIQSFSVLGLVLTGVSAVTAAILPSNNKSDASRFDVVGSLTATGNGNLVSCTPTANVDQAFRCNVTVASGTTGVGEGTISNRTTVGDA